MSSIDDLVCENGSNRRFGRNLPSGTSVTGLGQRLNRGSRTLRRNRWGAAAVEFAVIAPLFLLFVFGIIEFGRALMVQQMLTNASREGARLAVLDGSTTAEVESTVTDYLTTIQGADITVDPSPPSNAGFGAPVSVTVSIGFDQVSWLPTPMFLSGQNLSATTVMRRESVQ